MKDMRFKKEIAYSDKFIFYLLIPT